VKKLEIPQEIDLISFFECEPELLEEKEDIPFYYTQAIYEFSTTSDKFRILLSPSYGEFQLTVINLESNQITNYLDLSRVHKLDILSDQIGHKRMVLTIKCRDYLQTMDIEFQPYFKFILKDAIID
jgi:hypothetical protein